MSNLQDLLTGERLTNVFGIVRTFEVIIIKRLIAPLVKERVYEII